MIDAVSQALFERVPKETLYHYTSLSGLLGIIGTRELRASDIRYMNDSTELRHTLNLLDAHLTRRLAAGCDEPMFLAAFQQWLGKRVVRGPMLFGASFRANGNLLSQWRGYSVHGKGVSLGFDPEAIASLASAQGFSVGRCLYDSDLQKNIIEEMVNGVEMLAREASSEGHDPADGDKFFTRIEHDLLKIAAVLKHPAFEEEQEWRIVSPLIDDVRHSAIHFREGASMLVPYFAFELASAQSEGIALNHVYVGPSSNAELSMNSLHLYLAQHQATPRQGISYCQIPYRKR